MRNHTYRNCFLPALAALPFTLLSSFLYADVTGADPRLTAAPGDDGLACTACHNGGALNSFGGSVQIVLPGPATYTPGVKQHIAVKVTDAAQKRWGFELTARLVSNLTNGQAGSFASTDANTQVMCDTGRRAPCSSDTVVQFVTHTQTGTRLGASGGVTFEFDWTPPSTDLGPIRFYAAGNAANGNNLNSGDHIYTTSLEVTPAVVTPKPTISDNGITNAANPQALISAGAWITITGSNLATTTRTWNVSDFINGQMPVTLDNVSVTINGKPAFIEYVSPTRINALTPSNDALGPVEVKVTSNTQSSDAAYINLQSLAPAVFTYDGTYLATNIAANAMLDQSGRFFAAPADAVTPVAPGDSVVLYSTGLGATDPLFTAGLLPADNLNLVYLPNVTIGGIAAEVVAASLAAGSPGIYQITVKVPAGLPDGDQGVVIQINGVNSPAATIKVQTPPQA